MRKFYPILLLSVFMVSSAVAKEGMWLPSLIHKMNIGTMKEFGCELNAEDIYSINHASLKDAIVALDHGSCTAELVSADGLLLTNHHCGFGEIQHHSRVEHDYLEDGFWAMSKKEELPNPGKTATFLISVEDVTGKVLADVTDDMNEADRSKKIRETIRKIEEETEVDSLYDVMVENFFNGNQYFLFVTETFKDIRLVGAPPQSFGKFGGDTDNWMWPRHTNDFSMFRIYCSPDGKPAEYSEDNVPFNPKKFLPISMKGVKDGDFAMVFGYPGSTNRYKSSWGIDYTMKVTNTSRIVAREKKLGIIADYMATSQKAKIQYASKHARSANYYKNAIGQNEALAKLGIIAQKQELEKEFTDWVNADASRTEKYGEALKLIEESYKNVDASKAHQYLVETMVIGPELFLFANRASVLERLLEKPEENKTQIESFSRGLKASLDGYFKDYDAKTDEKIMAALLKIYADNNSEEYQPPFFDDIHKKYKDNYEKFAAKLFSKTIFSNKGDLSAFLDNPSLKVLKKDMGYQAAVQVLDEFRLINQKEIAGSEGLSKGRRLFVAGLMEMKPEKKFYPDANSTMRLTYGNVMDYEPCDGVIYKYYTTTDGYFEKEIPGDYEFNVLPKTKKMLLDKDFGRYADADGKLHTCFITDNDITGGNSGSPVINGNGELIGIAFDGNWEAMSGDLDFEDNLQRCINVDIRFVLWVIDKYAGAQNLIDEMEIRE